jgi:hypothetical protein
VGWTDTGDKAVIGGLSREFYHRVWKHYDRPEAWKWEPRAAAMAIDNGVSVQEVSYAKLRARLLADGQVLEWAQGPRPGQVTTPEDEVRTSAHGDVPVCLPLSVQVVLVQAVRVTPVLPC